MSRATAARETGYGTMTDRPAVDLATVRLTPPQAKGPVIGAIETGIPLPPRPGRQASELYQAVAELQPGQSRLFERVAPKKLYGHAKRAKEQDKAREYAVRAVGDGCRVWRLA